VWSGYVYPNFGEVLGILSPAAQSSHAFFDTWDGMGQPTFLQINEILNSFSASVEAYADSDPQVDFVKCTGVLQHVFGQTTPLAVAPGGTYVQFEAPMPIGYPEYPSPMNTMRDYFFSKIVSIYLHQATVHLLTIKCRSFTIKFSWMICTFYPIVVPVQAVFLLLV
jgi:hypothetical protein